MIAADADAYRNALLLVRGLDRVDSVTEVCALGRGKQADVLGWAGEKAVRLNGIAAGQREPEAGPGTQSD